MQFIARTAWNASAASPAAHLKSARGMKVHYQNTAYTSRSHSLCDNYVRSIRAPYLANTKECYVAIAYTALVCEHGRCSRAAACTGGPASTAVPR